MFHDSSSVSVKAAPANSSIGDAPTPDRAHHIRSDLPSKPIMMIARARGLYWIARRSTASGVTGFSGLRGKPSVTARPPRLAAVTRPLSVFRMLLRFAFLATAPAFLAALGIAGFAERFEHAGQRIAGDDRGRRQRASGGFGNRVHLGDEAGHHRDPVGVIDRTELLARLFGNLGPTPADASHDGGPHANVERILVLAVARMLTQPLDLILFNDLRHVARRPSADIVVGPHHDALRHGARGDLPQRARAPRDRAVIRRLSRRRLQRSDLAPELGCLGAQFLGLAWALGAGGFSNQSGRGCHGMSPWLVATR